jgi:DNA repair exonuclease SbcCD ATPase subunit
MYRLIDLVPTVTSVSENRESATMADNQELLKKLLGSLSDDEIAKLRGQTVRKKPDNPPESRVAPRVGVELGSGVGGHLATANEVAQLALKQMRDKMEATLAHSTPDNSMINQLVQKHVADAVALREKQMQESVEAAPVETEEAMDVETTEATEQENEAPKEEHIVDDPEVYSKSEVEGLRQQTADMQSKYKEMEDKMRAMEQEKAKIGEFLKLATKVEGIDEGLEKLKQREEKKRKEQQKLVADAQKYASALFKETEDAEGDETTTTEMRKQLLERLAATGSEIDPERAEELIKQNRPVAQMVRTAASKVASLNGQLSQKEKEIQALKKRLKERQSGVSESSSSSKGKSPAWKSSEKSVMTPRSCAEEVRKAASRVVGEDDGYSYSSNSEGQVKRKIVEFQTFASATWNKHPRTNYPDGYRPYADIIHDEIKYGQHDQFGWKEMGMPTPREVLSNGKLGMFGKVYNIVDSMNERPEVPLPKEGTLYSDEQCSSFMGSGYGFSSPSIST